MKRYLYLLLFALPIIYALSSFAQGYDALPVDPHYGAGRAEPTEIQKVTLDLGIIHSIIIPESWDSDNFALPGVRKFVRIPTNNNQEECKVSFELHTPVLISSQQARQLNIAMWQNKLTYKQIFPLKNLPGAVIEISKLDDKTSATVLNIKRKKVLLIERRDEHPGNCLFSKGLSEMPVIDSVRGVAYILINANKMQTINFKAEVWGDISMCTRTIEKAIKSIEWSK